MIKRGWHNYCLKLQKNVQMAKQEKLQLTQWKKCVISCSSFTSSWMYMLFLTSSPLHVFPLSPFLLSITESHSFLVTASVWRLKVCPFEFLRPGKCLENVGTQQIFVVRNKAFNYIRRWLQSLLSHSAHILLATLLRSLLTDKNCMYLRYSTSCFEICIT